MNFIEGTITSDGFESRHLDLPFDPATQGVKAGQSVTVGVRPEDVYLERNAEQAAAPTGTFSQIVDVLEPMGDEMFVYLLSDDTIEASAEGRGEGQTLMSVDPEEPLADGENIEVVLDRERIHLFDTESELAITHGLS